MGLLVTGATGFVGVAAARRMVADGLTVRGTSRRPDALMPEGVEGVVVGDLQPDTDWNAAVAGMDVVVHTAARVHMMDDSASDPLAEFRRVNVAGTLRLATQAASAGVKRFVFLSSIKVNGEHTALGRRFTAADVPAPADPYGVSKHEAEQSLREIARTTGMEVVIVRPVLVYGPGVRANFQSMMRWLKRGVPLPLGAIDNRRSLVGLDNLADLIVTVASHPKAANKTFLVSDGEDISTTELLRRLSSALDVRANLIPVPVPVLRVAGSMAGRGDIIDRLCSSLQVDISPTRDLLGWNPPVTLSQGLKKAADHFRQH